MSDRELTYVIIAVGSGFAIGVSFVHAILYKSRVYDAAVKAELMDTVERYKGMVEHMLMVGRVTERRAELAEREVKLLRGQP